eukprot:312112-Rhodomonas_salina.1
MSALYEMSSGSIPTSSICAAHASIHVSTAAVFASTTAINACTPPANGKARHDKFQVDFVGVGQIH